MLNNLGQKQIIKCQNEAHWLELRKQYVTSTNAATIMGVNNYESRVGLWAIKSGKVEEQFEDKLIMKIGRLVEPVIAELTIDHFDIYAHKDTDLHVRPEHKIASSLDFICKMPSEKMISLYPKIKEKNPVILECKNVSESAFRNLWSDNKPPLYIQCQVQHQMLCTGYNFCLVCALIGGNKMKYFFIERDDKFLEALLYEISEFWISVDENLQPESDQSEHARSIIQKLFPTIPEKVIDLRFDNQIDSQIEKQKELAKSETKIKKENETARNEIKEKLLDAQIGLTQNYKISISGAQKRLSVRSLHKSDLNNLESLK